METYHFPNIDVDVKGDGTARSHKRFHRGSANPNTGYMVVTSAVTGRTYLVHRLVGHAYVHNPAPKVFTQIDHIDHNKKNNHQNNLRWVSAGLNNLARKFRNYCKGKWGYRAYVNFAGTRYQLGWFKTGEAATQMSHDFKQLLFHVAFLEHCINARDLWKASHRSYLHGRPTDLAAAVERLNLGAGRYRNLRNSLLLLHNSFREAPRILSRFSNLETNDEQ